MQTKIAALKQIFSQLASPELLYKEIMEWGKKLLPFKDEWKIEENRVIGCQSLMYLHTEMHADHVDTVHFYATSDALISAGLAAILIEIYGHESPEDILKTQPTFLDEMGIPSALTPGRANGLASLYLKMKQEAVKYLYTS